MRENRLRGNLFDSYKMYTYLNASPNYRTIHTLLSVYFGLGKKGKVLPINIMTTATTTTKITHRIFYFLIHSSRVWIWLWKFSRAQTHSICGIKTFRFLFANGNYFDRRQMFFPSLLWFTLGFGLTCVDCSSSLYNFFVDFLGAFISQCLHDSISMHMCSISVAKR